MSVHIEIFNMTQVVTSQPLIKLTNFIKSSKTAWNFLQIDLFSSFDKITAIKTWKQKFLYTIRGGFFWINIMLLASYCIFRVLSAFPFDIEKFSFNISVFAAIFLSIVKYWCIYWNQMRISKILNTMTQRYSKFDSQKYQIEKVFQNFKRYISAYTVYMYFPIALVFFEPLSEFIVTGRRIFPFLMAFPFDATTNIIVYLLTFAFCVHTDVVCRTIILSNDHILYGLVTALALEFKVLAIKFNELNFMSESDIKVQLRDLIERHNLLIKNAAEIQEIFSFSFFLNFIFASLFICFTGFHMSTVENVESKIIDMIFCFFSLLQVFTQCFFGQMLKNFSGDLAFSIYDCDWEKIKDENLKKNLILVIARVQQPVQLSIMKVLSIDMEQFGNVSFMKRSNYFIYEFSVADFDIELFVLHSVSTNLCRNNLKMKNEKKNLISLCFSFLIVPATLSFTFIFTRLTFKQIF